MHSSFKSKVIQDNCFYTTFKAKLIRKELLKPEIVIDVQLGFVRDKSYEEEYFFVIEIIGKEKRMIPVDDLLEIEHLKD